MALLERDDLLENLEGLLERARSGSGSLALVVGEAGSGKTSLVREVTRRAGDQAAVLKGGCDPLSTPRPLGPLLDFAADPDSGLAGLLDGDLDNIEVFAAVLDRLKGSLRPILMVVEDVHWADDGTLDLIRFIGRRVEDTNALVVCTYRGDEVGLDHPLTPVLGQLAPMDTTHRLEVTPLSLAGVTTLVSGHSIDAADLHLATGGNAFYVTEVIAAEESLPASVQDAVLARVARLGPGPRRVVEAVSIAPRSLDVGQVGPLTGTTTSDIDKAVGSGVLLAEKRCLRFPHELARAAVEQSIPLTRRLGLHEKMLSLLQEFDPPDLARLAHHAVRADAGELIVQYAPAAAREAAKRGSRKEAIAFFEAALTHADSLEGDRVAELHLELATELSIVARAEEALKHTTLAAEHYRATGQPQMLANALILSASQWWRLSDPSTARSTLEEAIELLESLGPSRDLAFALYVSSHHSMLARHAQSSLAAVEESLTVARQVGAEDVISMSKSVTACLEVIAGDPGRGLALLRESAEDAKRRSEHHTVATALSNLGSGGGEVRLYDESIAALDEGIGQGLAHDEDSVVAYNRSWLARIAFEQGRWREAVEYAELVERTSPSRIGHEMVTAQGALGRVRVRRGDPGGRELLEEALRLGIHHELQHVWPLICGLGEQAWLAGDLERMPEVLEDGYRRALDTDSPWARGEIGFWMWKAGAIDGAPANSAEPFALQMGGDWHESAEAWRQIGCPYEVGLALMDGDELAVREALSIFDTLGARPAAGLARVRLRELGVASIPRGPTKQTSANPAGLTARQLEVLRLMATGMANGEIAAELFVSKKTVEHHVSAIFAKLGVETRPKAIALAADLEVTEI